MPLLDAGTILRILLAAAAHDDTSGIVEEFIELSYRRLELNARFARPIIWVYINIKIVQYKKY